MAVVNDLVTKFSFVGSTAPLDTYNKNLTGSIKLLGGMLVSLNVVSSAFIYWADGMLKGVDNLGALSKQVDISVGRLQELSFIAEQSQSSAEAMQSSISSLTAAIGNAAQKGGDDFSRLGISIRDSSGHVKNADQVLSELRGRFSALGLTMAEQRTFTDALGIDSSMLQLLNKTDAEIALLTKRARQLGTMTAEQTKQAEQYNQSMNAMWYSINSVKQQIAVGLAPELTRLADRFSELLSANAGWIVDGIKFAVVWIGNITSAINNLLPVFALMAAGFVAAKIATMGLGAAFATVFSPVYIITAAVVALLLVVEDLIVAFKGGNSVIANFFRDAFNVDIVEELTKSFDVMKGVLSGLFDVLTGIGKFLYTVFVETAKTIYNLLEPIASLISGPIGKAIDYVFKDQSTIPVGVGASPSGSIDNRQMTQQNYIEIRTNDADGTRRALDDTLQRQLENANNQLSAGGR